MHSNWAWILWSPEHGCINLSTIWTDGYFTNYSSAYDLSMVWKQAFLSHSQQPVKWLLFPWPSTNWEQECVSVVVSLNRVDDSQRNTKQSHRRWRLCEVKAGRVETKFLTCPPLLFLTFVPFDVPQRSCGCICVWTCTLTHKYWFNIHLCVQIIFSFMQCELTEAVCHDMSSVSQADPADLIIIHFELPPCSAPVAAVSVWQAWSVALIRAAQIGLTWRVWWASR